MSCTALLGTTFTYLRMSTQDPTDYRCVFVDRLCLTSRCFFLRPVTLTLRIREKESLIGDKIGQHSQLVRMLILLNKFFAFRPSDEEVGFYLGMDRGHICIVYKPRSNCSVPAADMGMHSPHCRYTVLFYSGSTVRTTTHCTPTALRAGLSSLFILSNEGCDFE